MIIRLAEDLEQIVHEAIETGLYAGEDEVIRDALTRLKPSIPPASGRSDRKDGKARPVVAAQQPVSPGELNRRLLAAGLVTELPNLSLDLDDSEEPLIEIEGEPLSETILRERR